MRFIIVLITSLFVLSLSSFAQNKKPRTGKESLFGKKLATYQITSNELSGACFYLVSGHGGPDPGAIGIYQGRQLYSFIMHRVAVKANVWRIICIAPLIRNTTSTSRTGDLPGR